MASVQPPGVLKDVVENPVAHDAPIIVDALHETNSLSVVKGLPPRGLNGLACGRNSKVGAYDKRLAPMTPP
jgi:hypothetical protein